jgi:hypothetical protein
MPEKREPSGKTAQTKTLVRGPDGALWLLSDTGVPHKLSQGQIDQVEKILTETEAKLSSEYGVVGVGVHVGHDVFDGHGVHCGIPEVPSD